MAYIIPPGFSRISVDYAAVSTAGSKPSWGIGVAASPDSGIVALVRNWVETDLAPITATYARIERIQMRNDVELAEDVFNGDGTKVAAFGPPSNAALITLSTGLVGRANRGRVYLPFVLPEPQLGGDGVLDPDLRSDISEAFGLLVGALDLDGAPLVILHSGSSDPTPVTSWTVQSLSATQRRRLRG